MQFKFIKNKANYLMHRAKCDFYTRIVNENSHNQSRLFSIAKNLLTSKNNLSFSDHQDQNCLINELGQYFISKIDTIRSQFNSNDPHTSTSPSTSPATSPSTGLLISPSISPSTSPSTNPSSPLTSPSTGPSNLCRLLNFASLSEDDVQKLISNTGKKYCAPDPMPTPLMLECLDTLLPVVTSQINLSLEYGVFPDMWKEAIGYPLLKKVGLGSSFPNLRLISNLSYISKLTEKAVFQHLNNNLLINKLYLRLQSAYRKYHSTETALLKITNDILLNMSNQQVSLLVLLDLSAAFDRIDHSILLNHLKQNFGINGTALSWFKSYLTNRKLHIHVDGSISITLRKEHTVMPMIPNCTVH